MTTLSWPFEYWFEYLIKRLWFSGQRDVWQTLPTDGTATGVNIDFGSVCHSASRELGVSPYQSSRARTIKNRATWWNSSSSLSSLSSLSYAVGRGRIGKKILLNHVISCETDRLCTWQSLWSSLQSYAMTWLRTTVVVVLLVEKNGPGSYVHTCKIYQYAGTAIYIYIYNIYQYILYLVRIYIYY